MGNACVSGTSIYVADTRTVLSSGSVGGHSGCSTTQLDRPATESRSPHPDSGVFSDQQKDKVDAEVTWASPIAAPPTPVPTPQDPKLPSLRALSQSAAMLVCGRVYSSPLPLNKVVYIVHCGTFTDCDTERKYMLKHVYPDIRDLCIRTGRELVVLDLHLDFPSEFVYGHVMKKFADMVMKALSPGENNCFLTIFLNERYGVYWCPPKVDSELFLDILNKVTDTDKQFLLSWYTLDETSPTPCYVINHVSDWLPVLGTEKPEDNSANARAWEKHSIRMKNILGQTSSAEFQKSHCKSILEQQLEEFVFSEVWPKEKVVWLKRNFTDLDYQSQPSIAKQFADLAGSSVNKVALDKLNELVKKLTNHLPGSNKLERNVQWQNGGLDPEEKLHKQYLSELVSSYKQFLKNSLNDLFNVKDELEILCRSSQHEGFTRRLFLELTEQAHLCRTFSERFFGSPSELTSLVQYLREGTPDGPRPSETAVQPLILHGLEGSGKSLLAAKLVTTSCQTDGWTNSVCVMRFVNVNSHCLGMKQLVSSLREQVCLMVGINFKECTLSLSELLTKTREDTPLLLVIDGLDKISPADGRMDLSWVPESLPNHTRLILTATTGTKLFRGLKNHLKSRGLELGPQGLDSVGDLLMSHLDMEPGVDLDVIQTHLKARVGEAGLSQLNVALLAVLLHEDMLEAEKYQDVFGATNEDLVENILQVIELRFHPLCVARLFGYLASTLYGLAEPELLDVLQRDKDTKELFGTNGRVLSLYLWLFVRKCLKNVLLVQMRHGYPVYSVSFSSFNKVVTRRYAAHIELCKNNLLNYFEWENNKNLTDRNSKGKQSPGCVMKQASLRSHYLRYGRLINMRKLEEVPWLLFTQNKVAHLCKHVLFNWQWIVASMESEGLLRWKLFLELGKEIAPTNSGQLESIMFLLHMLERLIPIVSSEKDDIVAQIHLRQLCGDITVPDVPELKELFHACQKSVGALLVSKRENSSTLRIALCQSQEDVPGTVRGLFRVRGDNSHMISVSPVAGEMRVFNVITGQTVRTFKGLKMPKDVKMSDTCTAVVLCDRELQVYNLDDGTHLSTLKGVLNLKMPYFGVHDKMHTIAIARNRMYVNMMNNSTGEMVTTFKVGEDRFMDSLLTSDNGCRCVCGDAVQKPFPLLVWDLNKRKLQYDLRIKGHEFLTKISAISDDGHYVVCSCKELDDPIPTFLVVYDLQSGAMFHKWKTEYSVTSVAISSRASVVLSAHTNGVLYVRNLISGVLVHELPGHARGVDVIKLDAPGARCVTYDTTGRDVSVRFWDIVKGSCLGTFYSGSGVSCCDISPDGRAVLVGIPGSDHVMTLLPPGESLPAKSDAVFGDSSRNGKVFDFSQSDT